MIVAAAAGGGCIRHPLDCEDTRLLARALATLGWPLEWDEEITVGSRRPAGPVTVNLGNSGTGSRLLLGLVASLPGRVRIDGSSRLRERPMAPLIAALRALGAAVESGDGHLPIEVEGGPLAGGPVRIRPGSSSQFVSALLLAGPLMANGLQLEVEGPLPSRPYLDLTVDVLAAFGAAVESDGAAWWHVGPGGLAPTTFVVEGDWSAAAFAAAATAVAGGSVTIAPVTGASRQGDRAVCGLLEQAGVSVAIDGDRVKISGRAIRAFEADLADTPDLFPAIAVVAAVAPPGSTLRGLDNLRHKESDRLAVMVDNLRRLGSELDVTGERLRVLRPIARSGSASVAVTAAADHRVAMAMAVAALAAGPLDLDDDACVAKSFPGFWDMWRRLLAEATTPP